MLAGSVAVLAVFTGGATAQSPTATPIDFARQVRPILASHCFPCHGPDAGRRKAHLRLDTKDGLFTPRKDGTTVVVPGDLAASEMVRRLTNPDPDERMPPANGPRPLSDEDRDLLVAWVRSGAKWEPHWAFVPPRAAEPPAVKDTAWPRNDIDRFVLARLEQIGLRPSPPADARTLVRRLYLDLTGLPPTAAEVDAFAADPSDRAYDRLVDRLLATPQHAEHLAHWWLDAARYADTHGLHFDNYREIWPYRDWVVRAFDHDMPYDQFCVRQIAGDLLPDATLDDRIATGFVRCHVTTNEGGSIEEEVYVKNVLDRTATFGSAFLGLTVGCATCHDHKFDPIRQEEFYGLFAFFNNLDGKPMDGNSKAHAPVVQVPSPEQKAQLTALDHQLADTETAMNARLDAFDYHEPPPPPPSSSPRHPIVWVDDALPKGAVPEGDGLQWVEAPHEQVASGRLAMRRHADGLQQHFFTHADEKLCIGDGDDVLFCSVWIDPTDPPRELMLQWNADGGGDWEHRAFWGEDVIPFGQPGTLARHRLGDLPKPGQWMRLAVRAADVGLHRGMAVHGIAFTQHGGTVLWDAAGLETAAEQAPRDWLWIDDDAPLGGEPRGDGPSWQWQTGPAWSGRRYLRRSGGDGLEQDVLENAPPVHIQHGDRLFAHVWLDPEDPPRSVQLQWHSGSWEHRARWGAPAYGAGGKGGADHVVSEAIPPLGRWVRLEVPIEDVGLMPGADVDGIAFTQVGGTVYWDAAGLRTWGPPDDRSRDSLTDWEQIAAASMAVPDDVRTAARATERSPEQQRLLRRYFLRHVHPTSRAAVSDLSQQLAALTKQRDELNAQIPTTLVMVERKEPRPAYVLRRGQYDARGPQVERITPSVLPPMAADLPRDRLGLAEWLVSRDNPLTARVAVNRFWQHVFGTGLVRTSEDFGSQGSPPTHPELLDWLAVKFMDDGWSVDGVLRRIVLSATYRQSAVATPETLAADPDDRLLERSPRYRLDAEVLRDQALSLSGLLNPATGGPPVKPPQPPGLWKAVGYVGSNTDHYVADTEPSKVHRRSLYTFWKRTAPPPEMSVFDAPTREACVVRRERTNTPLQALLMMNDPQYLECARALAEHALREGGNSVRARAAWLFERATCRPPTDAELAELLAVHEAQCAQASADPAAAQKLVQIGATPPDPALDPCELSAWMVVANLVLNLDEVLTRS